jgi:putative restriction endonuclease
LGGFGSPGDYATFKFPPPSRHNHAGYVTVTPELRFEVSGRIREEFDNGIHYYALHGQTIDLPEVLNHRPDPAALSWHNEYRFNG